LLPPNREPVSQLIDGPKISGQVTIEYGLIAAGISVAIIAVVQGLGSKLNTTFTSVQTALK
jgi:pilus assembly protein Flp/PilA